MSAEKLQSTNAMRKTAFFVACCIVLMLLASCKKDPVAPTISVFNGVGYVTEDAFVYSGDEITVGFVATGENLTKMEVTLSQSGTTLTYHAEDIEKLASYSFSHTFTINARGTVTITGTITDAVGQTAISRFNILCEEKPNAKFLGHYEGNALATGTMETNISNLEPMNQEFTDREVPVVLDLYAGEDINEVVGTCKFEDRTIDCNGIVDGDVVTFEAIDDVITFNYDLGGFNVSPELHMTYTIKGTLTTNGKLALDGTCSGHGDINLFIYNGTTKINATVGGSLDKRE